MTVRRGTFSWAVKNAQTWSSTPVHPETTAHKGVFGRAVKDAHAKQHAAGHGARATEVYPSSAHYLSRVNVCVLFPIPGQHGDRGKIFHVVRAPAGSLVVKHSVFSGTTMRIRSGSAIYYNDSEMDIGSETCRDREICSWSTGKVYTEDE